VVLKIHMTILATFLVSGTIALGDPTPVPAPSKKITQLNSACSVESFSGDSPVFKVLKESKEIYNPKSLSISGVHFSPTGRFVAFSSAKGSFIDIPGQDETFGLVIVDCENETAQGYRKGKVTRVRWWWKEDAGLTFTDGTSLMLSGGEPSPGDSFSCYFTGFEIPRPVQQSNCAFRTHTGGLQLRSEILKQIEFNDKNLAEGTIGAEGCFWLHKNRTLRRVHCFDNGADPFEQGYARLVGNSGKFGYVNEKLAIVLPPQFDFAYPFNGGQAKVCMGCKAEKTHPGAEHSHMKGGKWKIISAKGEVLKNCLGASSYEDCEYVRDAQ